MTGNNALTVLQPWATMIVCGWKTIETRSWATPYRGRLIIHAAKRTNGIEWAKKVPGLMTFLKLNSVDIDQLSLGCLVGEVNLSNIQPVDTTQSCLAFGWLCDGPLAWNLIEAKVYETPIKMPGKQGLWRI